MSDLSICNIINKENGAHLTLFTEWSDLKLKIIIAEADKVLEGEILTQDFSPYAEIFEKSMADYLKNTQDILAGKNNDIDFVLKNEKFLWKRKKWSLGQVDVRTLSENSYISSFILNTLNKFSRTLSNFLENEEKLKNAENTISELRSYITDMIKKKEQSELEWYKRTALLLNSKKAKIRDLKKQLEKYESDKDSIFDADTENSDSETSAIVSSDVKCRQFKRRKSRHFVESDNEETTLKKKYDTSIQTKYHIEKSPIKEQEAVALAINSIINSGSSHEQFKNNKKQRDSFESDQEIITSKKLEEVSSKTEILNEESLIKVKETIASGSKVSQLSCNIGEDEETPDFLTDESECEVELKFEDDKNQNEAETQGNAVTREESSEELF